MNDANMVNAVMLLLFFLLLAGGLLVLQVFLSMQKAPWPGLVLPVLGLLAAASVTVARVLYSVELGGGMALMGLWLFVLASIPSLVGFGVYRLCREKVRERRSRSVREEELSRMTMQDLD